MDMQKNKRLEGVCKTIHLKKSYCIALKKRIHLIKTDYSEKNDFQKNEIDILNAETLMLLLSEFKSYKKYEQLLAQDLNEFYNDLEEVNNNYENILALAKKNQSENIELKHLLYHANWKFINDNIEEKIKIYKNIKELLKC